MEIVKLLVEHGAGVNATDDKGYNPLDRALRLHSLEIADFLRGNGAKANKVPKDIIEAAMLGDSDKIRDLLSAEGKSIPQNDLDVALIYTARNGDTELARHLIDNGADVNAPRYSNKPLLLATMNGWADTVALLISKGANLNPKGTTGATPLYHAVKMKNCEIAALLIQGGCNLEARDIHSLTPLHCALMTEELEEMICMLLDAGCEVNPRIPSGHTPLDWADDEEIRQLLRRYGALTKRELKEKEKE